MLTYLMVARVAQLCPGAVLTKLDKLVEPLKQTVTTKVKANAVKQEYEKQDELKRSAMRAVAALMHVPGAGIKKNLFTFLSAICLQHTSVVLGNRVPGTQTRNVVNKIFLQFVSFFPIFDDFSKFSPQQ